MILELVTALTGPISSVLERLIPDATERARTAHELATLAEKQANQQVLAQIELNKAEANHASVFVAGWRPFIGWTSGFGLLFYTIIAPCMVAFGLPVPPMDLAPMITVLGGMLGIGGLRTYEKVQGKARVNFKEK